MWLLGFVLRKEPQIAFPGVLTLAITVTGHRHGF
jgi:hypothetical protein